MNRPGDQDQVRHDGAIPKAQAVEELERRRQLALGQGGDRRVAAKHAKGYLTARERIDLLFTGGRFVEIGQLALSDREEVGERAPADAVVVGVGDIDGRKVAALAIDSTVLAGTNGRVGMRKQAQITHLAIRKGYPLVILGDANGGRIPDLLGSIFAEFGGNHEGEHLLGLRHERVRIPRVTAIMGPSYGDPSLYGAISDFVVMNEDASMGISGPPLVQASTGEATTDEELAGPQMAARTTGVAHLVVRDDEACITAVRSFLAYLPSNAALEPPQVPPRLPAGDPDDLNHIVPDRFKRAYDVHRVIDHVVDDESFFEIRPEWGRSIVGGFGRIEGRPVGVIASQPMYRSGVLDDQSCVKATDLINLCDTFGLPIVFLQDIPGVLIGSSVERNAILKKVMGLFSRLAVASVPRVTVILRKAYGLGWALMGGTPMGTDYVVAWPNAEIGFMAPEAAVSVVHKRTLEEIRAEQGDEAVESWIAEQEANMHHDNAPWTAAAHSFLHDVIRPEETRQAVLDGLFLGEGYLSEGS